MTVYKWNIGTKNVNINEHIYLNSWNRINLGKLTCHEKQSIHYHYFYYCEFFTQALTGGFSLEYEWQQVYSAFKNPSNILIDFNIAVIWFVCLFVCLGFMTYQPL